MALLPNIFGWNRPNARYVRFWDDSPKMALFGKIAQMLAGARFCTILAKKAFDAVASGAVFDWNRPNAR